MSRSYRNNLWITQQGKAKAYFKNQANRKIRRSENVPDGNSYKKFYCSYNISDYCFPADGYEPWWQYKFK